MHDPSAPHSESNRHDCVAGPPAHEAAHANVLPSKQQTSPAPQSAASSHSKSHCPDPVQVVAPSGWQVPAVEPLAQHAWVDAEQSAVPVALAPLQSTRRGALGWPPVGVSGGPDPAPPLPLPSNEQAATTHASNAAANALEGSPMAGDCRAWTPRVSTRVPPVARGSLF